MILSIGHINKYLNVLKPVWGIMIILIILTDTNFKTSIRNISEYRLNERLKFGVYRLKIHCTLIYIIVKE